MRKANSITLLNETKSRGDAFYQVGRYTVDNCDILIAVWNGKPAAGKGGTAAIVKYARANNKWIYWINSENGIISEEGNKENEFKYLKIYNNEDINKNSINNSLNKRYKKCINKANEHNLSSNLINKLTEKLLPQSIKASSLARKYQKRYRTVGTSIYVLSAGAVATVTIQILFFPNIPQLILAEFIEISFILILLLISRKQDWHRKWVDYRFLAECLRPSLFFRVANIKREINIPPAHITLSDNSKDWITKAFDSIWSNDNCSDKKIPLNAFKNFILDLWINDQLTYYQKSAKKNGKNNEIFKTLGLIFFILTLIAAALHAFNIEIFKNTQILIATAIILPAVAASLTGISNNREYGRNAERYKQMSQNISHIKELIEEIEDMESLVEILDKANQIMLAEHQDWRVVVQFNKKLHPP